MRILKYYYFRVYSYYSNGDSVPLLSTFLVIFLFAFFNLLSFLAVISSIMKFKFTLPVFEKGPGRLLPLLIVLPFFGLFYYLVKVRDLHNTIIGEFKEETSRGKFLSKLSVLIYFVSSIVLIVMSLFLRERLAGY